MSRKVDKISLPDFAAQALLFLGVDIMAMR
jgi:hypothetical protein